MSIHIRWLWGSW